MKLHRTRWKLPACISDCSILAVITGFSHANQGANLTNQLSIKIHMDTFGQGCMDCMQRAWLEPKYKNIPHNFKNIFYCNYMFHIWSISNLFPLEGEEWPELMFTNYSIEEFILSFPLSSVPKRCHSTELF